jgi:hypothetical protein
MHNAKLSPPGVAATTSSKKVGARAFVVAVVIGTSLLVLKCPGKPVGVARLYVASEF